MNDTDNQAPKTAKKRGRRPLGQPNTKTLLIENGIVEFARLGFDGASLRTIAKNAGTDMALIARLFGSKLGLWQAIVVHFKEKQTIDLQEFSNKLKNLPTAQAKFQAYVAFVIEISCENPHLASFLFQEQAIGGERYAILEEQVILPFVAFSLPIVRFAKEHQVIDYVDEILFLQMLISAISHQTLPAIGQKIAFNQAFKDRLLEHCLRMWGKS